VLTDDATAGAAEIFAAALHDRASAVTVGEGTAGMAVVQRQVPTPSGGILWMTVGRYVSPSGSVLGGKGLSPDERVLVLSGDGLSDKDPILERGLEIARNPAARKAA
jgi:carboxyl-terminal processing protease